MRPELIVLAVALSCAAPAQAQWRLWESDYDEEAKSWKEIQAQLPAYPKPANLILLEAGGATSHKFYVDVASISVGEDGVVRYTTVIKTAAGATNVAFEGMRCETREGKLYALGRSDGTWVRARNPKWQRILLRDLKPHHWVLYREFFCPSPAMPTPPRVAIDALRRGVGLASSNATDE